MTGSAAALAKRETGIIGLDRMTGGGLPAAGGALILGRPAAGKTVLTLQLVAMALARGQAAIFVSFEESREQLLRNAAAFDWGRQLNDDANFALIDARPGAGAQIAGEFDLEGLLAAVGHCVERTGAEWVIFDGIDQLLRRHRDPLLAADQVHLLSSWCEERGLTLLLTGKLDHSELAPRHLDGVEFLLSTVLVLSTRLVASRLARRFRIAKYRGSAHTTDEVPMLIDAAGVHFPYSDETDPAPSSPAPVERISTGVDRLDEVLGGGLYRGSTTLISGKPGTAKTTLCGSFAAAAAARGEKVLFLSFDELQAPVTRNLATVGVDLNAPIRDGLVSFHAREAWSSLLEEHYFAIRRAVDQERPHCVVVDPASALFKVPGGEAAKVTVERLLSAFRKRGITTILTSLGSQDDPVSEATLSHASTLADTWLVLGFNVTAGERNRSISVVKSRGSSHSNQVRELMLSGDGIDLADVYEYGSEVLMGTARLQKQNEETFAGRLKALADAQRKRELEHQIQLSEAEAERLRLELAAQEQERATREAISDRYQLEVLQRRHSATLRSDRSSTGADPKTQRKSQK